MTPTQVWQTHATELPADPVITFFKVFFRPKKKKKERICGHFKSLARLDIR